MIVRPLCLALALLALACGCKQSETQLKLQFPGGDGGTCEQQTSIKCVNYLQFTVGAGEFSSCTKVEVVLDDLCDLAKVAAGQELFNLPPETPLPITIEGLRIFPAIGCSSIQECTPRKIFSGTTVGGGGRPGRIGDHAGGVLELPVKVNEACGLPEEFFPLPEGRTCTEVCGLSPVVCDHVAGGCLCKGSAGAADMVSRQGAIDSGQ
jgi:hypothetical protein